MAVSAAIDAPGPGSASTTKPPADSAAAAAGASAPSVPRVAAVQDGGEGDDELGDDDSRDDDDEDEGEEDEPRLKYQRLGGSVPSLLSSDAAACLTVGERIIALGTHDGTVHLLDFQGNQVFFLSLFCGSPHQGVLQRGNLLFQLCMRRSRSNLKFID
jgi:hypothetical protein